MNASSRSRISGFPDVVRQPTQPLATRQRDRRQRYARAPETGIIAMRSILVRCSLRHDSDGLLDPLPPVWPGPTSPPPAKNWDPSSRCTPFYRGRTSGPGPPRRPAGGGGRAPVRPFPGSTAADPPPAAPDACRRGCNASPARALLSVRLRSAKYATPAFRVPRSPAKAGES